MNRELLSRYLRPHKKRIGLAVLAMAVVALFNGLSVLVLKPIVDHIFIAKDTRMLWFVVSAIPVFMAIKAAASYSQNYFMSWLGQRVTHDLRKDLFRRLQALPLDYYSRHETGETLSRVTSDLVMVQTALTSLPLYLIRDTMTVAVLLVALFALDWRFALLSLVGVPITSVVLLVLGRKMRAASLASQSVLGRLHQRFQEAIDGSSLIKSFNYEDALVHKFEDENALFFAPAMRYLRATALAGPAMEFCGSLVAAAILYFGGCEVILGRMTPGAFFAFLGAFFAAYAPLKNIARSQSELQRALASADRILQLLEEHPACVLPGVTIAPFKSLRQEIRLDGVTYTYSGRTEPALNGCSFTIPAGKRTAIVGPSGSGKTTITQLLLRLHEPGEGSILFDGMDARRLDARSLRSQIGLVSQHTLLFNDTVFENVALGKRVVTMSSVERACALAGAAGFIERLPQGYSTRLGEHGLALSAGQRQKLALARVILKEPSILILDEHTANLDAESEADVNAALAGFFRGRTVIMIVHKLTTLPGVDQVVVLNQGQVAETGSPRELLARDGLFKRLHALQHFDGTAGVLEPA